MANRQSIYDRYDRFEATSRHDWRDWLLANHGAAPGIWLVTYRPGSERPRVRYDDAVEEALCFGWIDSQAKALDAERSMQLYTPRRPGSGWSRPNKVRIERLSAAGLMQPAGLTTLDAAKRDGSWTLYDAIEDLAIPDDLAAALAAASGASAAFDALGLSVRKQMLWSVVSAKRAATRSARIERIMAGLAAGTNSRANQEQET
ncbi:MAG: YdeI/OmpD-associated family protein [Chloroflexota bacterium]|nr:YdeI/OmpD-associated family protein [Chloroflexota bacterium]